MKIEYCEDHNGRLIRVSDICGITDMIDALTEVRKRFGDIDTIIHEGYFNEQIYECSVIHGDKGLELILWGEILD